MGRSNQERRAAKKRKKAQKRAMRLGPQADEQPFNFRFDDDGSLAPLDVSPFEYIYYDEPDFLTKCDECGGVSGSPICSMKKNPAFVAEHGDFEMPEEVQEACHHCKASFTVRPRKEVGASGETLYTIDREVLIAAGQREVRGGGWSITLEDPVTGETVELVTSDSDDTTLVVCDDCGLPFEMKGAQALTTVADSAVQMDHLAGPCDHCGGLGHPLLLTASGGGLRTTSNSLAFANEVLLRLADEVASGRLDLHGAARELRARNSPPLTHLADWLESRPVTVAAASALISVVATLVSPHLGPAEEPQGYTEQEVIELVDRILDHYDERNPPAIDDQHRRDRKKDGR